MEGVAVDFVRVGVKVHGALSSIRTSLQIGFQEVLDADLSSCFSTLDQEKLMECLKRRIAGRSVFKLIRMWLQCVMVEEGKNGRPKKGTPQGGVISPVLRIFFYTNSTKGFTRQMVLVISRMLVFSGKPTTG